MSDRVAVKISFYIDKEIHDDFIELVKEKYKNYHGNLSAEGEEALRAWLRTHKHAQQLATIQMNPDYPHVHVYMDRIVKRLKEEYGCLLQCDLETLKKAIVDVRGSDERTAKKWMKQLLQEKKIKWLRPGLFEIV